MQAKIRVLTILGLGLMPLLAFAGGVKPGLWEVEMEGMPAMPQIPPEQLEQMKKAGVDLSKMVPARKPQLCMTEEQAKMDRPPPTDKRNKDCKVDSWDRSGKTMKGHMTCDGDFKGTIDMTADLKSDTEYHTDVSMDGTSHNQPVKMNMKSTARWVSVDCGNVKPMKH